MKLCSLLAATVWGLALQAESAPLVFHHENVLGTSLELKFAEVSPADAARGETAALAEIDRLARILSTYDPRSEISQWLATRNQPVAVSRELLEVLALFDDWRVRSDGALDAAAGAACQLWKSAGKSNSLPTAEEIAGVVLQAQQCHWTLDAKAQTATHRTAAPLVFNSFAKSYILEHAARCAQTASHANSLVLNIGGDLVVLGSRPETVAVVDPRNDAENTPSIAAIRVQQRAVATSGGYRRGVSIGGHWYSHIVDPRTGYPVSHLLSATVVAPKATDAGALATALCVLKPDEGLHLVASVPDAECLLLGADGRRWTSPGWDRLEVARPSLASSTLLPGILAAASPASDTAPASKATTWDASLELVVNLEVARPDGDRVRRPYVAVWVEDKDKFPVRTMALWFKGDRWLPDLRAWYHSEQLRSLAEGSDITTSVSSATRSPGRYTLKWDGKDNAGKTVKAGRYTVYIEAAREHGTYQLMKQEIDFNGTPVRHELKGNTEIAGASLDYRRKADGR